MKVDPEECGQLLLKAGGKQQPVDISLVAGGGRKEEINYDWAQVSVHISNAVCIPMVQLFETFYL